MTPWHKAFLEAEKTPGFLNLTDTNFHKAGWIHPKDLLEPLWGEYLDRREYAPDPRGSREAREAAASLYSGLVPAPEAEDFFLTASTSEAYSLLFSLLCAPGDQVLVPRPGYPLFEHLAAQAKVTVGHYTLTPGSWEITPEALDSAWTPRTKVLVAISPHNPTGRVFTAEEILHIQDFCARTKTALIWDEVFDPWIFSGKGLPRPWEPRPRVPTFLLNGISKRFACADLKLGWILARFPEGDRSLSAGLEMANDSLLSCSSFAQFLLPHLFLRSVPLSEKMVREAQTNREILSRKFGLTEERLPQGGLHALLDFPDSPWEDETLSIKLLRRGLSLHPGFFYDLPGCRLVISLVQSPVKFEMAAERLREALRTLT